MVAAQERPVVDLREASQQHELREEHEISFTEYEVLVRLSETEDGRMRMATLADAMSHSRSRVTHTITRMETRQVQIPTHAR